MRDPRPWTYAALFGTLWGALELSLGTALNLAGVPLYGVAMSLLGLVCLVTLRRLQPRPGVCLLAGATAAFLKIFALGGLRPGPLVGIGLEAALVELAFVVCGTTAVGAAVGGALALVAPPLQMTAVIWAVLGSEGLDAYAKAAMSVIRLIGVEQLSGEVLLAILLLAASGLGLAGGWWSWRLAGRVQRRLGWKR